MSNGGKNDKLSLEEKFKLVADTIRAYPLQLKQAWEEINSITIPDEYKSVQNMILCGMGGSALGGRMVDSLIPSRLRIPFEIFTEYHIPNYIDEKSLVIISSYSGTTEETINCAYEALNKNAKVFGITTGGKLAEILRENNLPGYIFEPKNNPSGQPRMSIGYASGAILALLSKLGLIQVLQEEIDSTIDTMNSLLTEYHENAPSDKNLAKSYAEKLKNKACVLVASEHLVGTAHTIKNHLNESAKTFSVLFDIPELNHHLMEGLTNPKNIKRDLEFIFIDSNLYFEKVSKRYPLTQEVIKKNGFEYHVYKPGSEKKLSQVFETLIFGSFMVFYLTKLYQIDPLAIPWVDYFKDKLAK